MATTAGSLPWILVCLAAVAFAAGIVLLILGRGRRIGQEPYCRKCGYNLTGLTADRCPECGHPASAPNIVFGTRHRRWRLLAPGLVLLLLSLAGGGMLLVGSLRSVDWYKYLPTFVLVEQARGDDSRAIWELTSRFSDGSISEKPLHDLIPLALTQQGTRPRVASAAAWTELLASLERGGQLTTFQREEFHDQIISFDMDFRRRLRHGEEFKVSFETAANGSPKVAAECTIEHGVLAIGNAIEKEFHFLGHQSLSEFGSASIGIPIPISGLAPGKWQVQLHASKTFTNPDFTRDIDLTYDLEILPPDSPEVIKLVKDPKIGQQLRRAITIRPADEVMGSEPKPHTAYMDIEVKGAVPADVAFVLILRDGDREIDAGTLTKKASTNPNTLFRTQRTIPAASLSGDSMVPILRTSIEAAKEEPDIIEIWDGELVFPPIQLKASLAATSTAPSSGP